MNLKNSLQTSAIFTGVASMYIAPILAFAVGDRPEHVTVLKDPVQARKVQFYFEDSPEETQENDPSELSDSQLEEVHGGMSPPVFDRWRVEKINEWQVEKINESVIPVQELTSIRKSIKKKRNRYQDCQDNPGISQSGDRYHVDRDVVDHYTHRKHYSRLGHARWHEGQGGERDGIRLRRIHCDLHEAGMRNGDVVNSIDGRTVSNIREAIRLWFKVRRKNQVVLDITRKGQPLTLTYQLT
jgi:hypothetical protein